MNPLALIEYLSKALNMSQEQAAPLAQRIMSGQNPFNTEGASGSAINTAVTPFKPNWATGAWVLGQKPPEMKESDVEVKTLPDVQDVEVRPNRPLPPEAGKSGNLTDYLNQADLPQNAGAKATEDYNLQLAPGTEIDRLDRMKQWADAWNNSERRNPDDLTPGSYLTPKAGKAGRPIERLEPALGWGPGGPPTEDTPDSKPRYLAKPKKKAY